MEKIKKQTKPFDTKRSVLKASGRTLTGNSSLNLEGKEYSWSNKMERVEVIRAGIPYGSIEAISRRLNNPVKSVLAMVGIPQTTYNKKKAEHSLLDSRN